MGTNNDPTNFSTSASGSVDNVCKLIIIGLEGVGKTTLLNEACGENFHTSDEPIGCQIQENQKGSFYVDEIPRTYELIDMLGINYGKPGEWQKTLHGRSEVHGVIFLINASNPRDSALGELPRINDYCSNLKIPKLFIYRDGKLRFTPSIQIYAKMTEKQIEDKNTKEKMTKTDFERYTNLDEVKRLIAETFKSVTESHQLLDPITICKRVKDLEKQVKDLEKENDQLRRSIDEHEKRHQEELNQHKTTIDTLKEHMAALVEDKKRLEKQKNSLKKRKNLLEDQIDGNRRDLEGKLNTVVDVRMESGEQKQIHSKQYDTQGKWMWLPGRAYHVMDHYKSLAENVNDVISHLRDRLHEMKAHRQPTQSKSSDSEDTES